ncbi:Uma2 family endonuclease [Ectothiorhodospiraceae bacterium BW-2]|nr:Uma2 family endonuclease [Ectothiorhodospiraceae bacterium BW-2]
MLKPKSHQKLSVADYLEDEKLTETRHELIDGEVYAMSGTSANHARITGNFAAELRQQLKRTPCEPFTESLKLRVGDNFYYPDVMVSCDESDKDDPYYRQRPILLVEVLSKSTQQYDRTHKAEIYRTIPSLQEYVLIEQDRVDVEVQRRSEGWVSRHYYLGDEVPLESVGTAIPVTEIYDRVENGDVAEWLAKQAAQAPSESV